MKVIFMKKNNGKIKKFEKRRMQKKFEENGRNWKKLEKGEERVSFYGIQIRKSHSIKMLFMSRVLFLEQFDEKF